MGVHIAIDDFGTGYSSLSYISRLPVHSLKIDRSFIHGMTDDPDKTSVVSSIISLGHALRMEVVAEGVETEAQSQLLRLLRCDQIQGYLVSRPLPGEAMKTWLKSIEGAGAGNNSPRQTS
jgi:EAL domain-containing protein (putative c-di-GMP-specific phosphodiesterase class I)